MRDSEFSAERCNGTDDSVDTKMLKAILNESLSRSMIRENRLRDSLESGSYCLGARTLLGAPTIIELYGDLGLDFVWVDTEHSGHSPYDSRALKQYVRLADAANIEPFVRLATSDPAAVRNVLDAGVGTILIPRIKTPQEAKAAVQAGYYTYNDGPGERGIGRSQANNWGRNMDRYPDQSDQSVLIGLLIETAEAVANIDEILSIPELGFIFLGPIDLSISMGHPMDTDHPDVSNAVEMMYEKCEEYNVPYGTMASDASTAVSAIEDGAQIVRIGDDIPDLRTSIDTRLQTIQSEIE